MPRSIKKRRNDFSETTNSYLSWIKHHVSETDLGKMLGARKGAHPVHLNKNHQVLEHFGRLRVGRRSWLDSGWDWSKIRKHGAGKETYYFAGAPDKRKARTLFMLDVDCKRRGTPEQAQAFLAYLASDACRAEYGLSLPGLYTEVSTHGRGGHGFPILDKQDCGAAFINGLLLRRLQPWLARIASEKGFGIELVEVKGTLPVVEWGQAKCEVLSYKSGCLGKLPREGEARFRELRATAVITVDDLLRLPVCQKAVTISAGTEAKRQKEMPVGSVSGRHITDEMLAGLEEGRLYRAAAEKLLGADVLGTSGRQVAKTEDVAIALMLGEWFTRNMPSNGGMPEERWRGLWCSLYDCGQILRGWCHKRFKAIRDWLSSLGLLEWKDETYVRGWHDESGAYHKGQAAKWHFGEGLMAMLSQSRETKSGENPVNGGGEMHKAVNSEVEAAHTGNQGQLGSV